MLYAMLCAKLYAMLYAMICYSLVRGTRHGTHARIQEFSPGGGGVQVNPTKNALTTFFFSFFKEQNG